MSDPVLRTAEHCCRRRHLIMLALCSLGIGTAAAAAAAERLNVLFIAIDDQNDWIGHLGGHPLAQTPHLDALAARGTTFTNAHCQAPLCNPSRTSLLLGLRPTTTGIYGLAPWFRTIPEWADRVSLPQHFAQHGYLTAATGKIYHGVPAPAASKKQTQTNHPSSNAPPLTAAWAPSHRRSSSPRPQWATIP